MKVKVVWLLILLISLVAIVLTRTAVSISDRMVYIRSQGSAINNHPNDCLVVLMVRVVARVDVQDFNVEQWLRICKYVVIAGPGLKFGQKVPSEWYPNVVHAQQSIDDVLVEAARMRKYSNVIVSYAGLFPPTPATLTRLISNPRRIYSCAVVKASRSKQNKSEIASHGLRSSWGYQDFPAILYPYLAGYPPRTKARPETRSRDNFMVPSPSCMIAPLDVLAQCVQDETREMGWSKSDAVTTMKDQMRLSDVLVIGGILRCIKSGAFEAALSLDDTFYVKTNSLRLGTHISQVYRYSNGLTTDSNNNDLRFQKLFLKYENLILSRKVSLLQELFGGDYVVVTWITYCGCSGFEAEVTAFVASLSDVLPVEVNFRECMCRGKYSEVEDKISRMHNVKRPSSISGTTINKYVQILHVQPKHYSIRTSPNTTTRIVGRSMFEADRIPSMWVERINSGQYVDEVWVPCTFLRDVFVQSGVIPALVHVVPEPIDVNMYNPPTVPAMPEFRNMVGAGAGTYIFFSNFKWEERKGWDILCTAYFTTFTPSDDVILVIKTHLFNETSEQRAVNVTQRILKYAISVLGMQPEQLPRFFVLDGIYHTADVPRLYRSVDCFVLPTRGEGWGLPIHEAMAMGLPVIATAWSGPVDFMTNDTALMLNIEGLEPSRGAFVMGKGSRWAVPSTSHLKWLIRWVFEHQEEGRRLGIRAREHIVQHFSQEAVLPIVLQNIQRNVRLMREKV
eukprot:PhF_6_TR32191/c0_g1_i2/m.47821